MSKALLDPAFIWQTDALIWQISIKYWDNDCLSKIGAAPISYISLNISVVNVKDASPSMAGGKTIEILARRPELDDLIWEEIKCRF